MSRFENAPRLLFVGFHFSEVPNAIAVSLCALNDEEVFEFAGDALKRGPRANGVRIHSSYSADRDGWPYIMERKSSESDPAHRGERSGVRPKI